MSDTKNIPLEYINYLSVNDQIDQEKNNVSTESAESEVSLTKNLLQDINNVEEVEQKLNVNLDNNNSENTSSDELIGGEEKPVFGPEEPQVGGQNEGDQGDEGMEVEEKLNVPSIYNDQFLNYMEPSKTTLYTIPQGTILYHGSLYKESFNPYDIRLGDDKLVSYFSPNKRLSADYIIGCALYPTKAGFLHKFRTKREIPRVMIVSSFEKQPNWTLRFIEDSFCSRRFRIQLDGIGFFYPRKDESTFTSLNTNPDTVAKVTFDSEFAICDPNYFLEYVSTQRCVSNRKLSPEYHFSK